MTSMKNDPTIKAYLISDEDHMKFYQSNINPPINYNLLVKAWIDTPVFNPVSLVFYEKYTFVFWKHFFTDSIKDYIRQGWVHLESLFYAHFFQEQPSALPIKPMAIPPEKEVQIVKKVANKLQLWYKKGH